MADEILEKVRDVVDGQIDFEGQRLADLSARALLATVGAVAFIVGYALQDIRLALWIGLGGTALTFIAVVPPWSYFNKDSVAWLPIAGTRVAQGRPQEIPGMTGIQGITVDGKLVG